MYGLWRRVDFVLTRASGRRVFVEVKSVTLAERYDAPADVDARAAAGTARAGGIAAVAAVEAVEACGQDSTTGSRSGDATPQEEEGSASTKIALFPDTVRPAHMRHALEA